jgi:colanic acid biosynthesis protein WcaH
VNAINRTDFLTIIDATPLVSIDLILENPKGQILLGKRVNRPAKDFWFVPGGRIRKNETLSEAIKRISSFELGIEIKLEDAQLLGAFDHIYEDNFAGTEGINTHYVALGHKASVRDDVAFTFDDQHTEFSWWDLADLLADANVHENTKAYFRK